MKLDFEPSEVVFLLGAGSSITARIPDTYEYVTEKNNYKDNNILI